MTLELPVTVPDAVILDVAQPEELTLPETEWVGVMLVDTELKKKSELHGASPPLFFNSVAFIPVKRDTQQNINITE